ncbi:gamma-glutamylcyclotransferase family protein [Gemmobacter lanyuensis]
MTDLFFYGTLCHLPLLETVLARPVDVEPATLPGHRVQWSAEGAGPFWCQIRGRGPRDAVAGRHGRGSGPAGLL